MNSGLIILSAILFIIVVMAIMLYNGLIGKKNNIKNAFSTIDVMLKKRHDLIPSLVETIQEYVSHEKGILTEVVKLRSQIIDTKDLPNSERVNLENQLTNQLKGLNITVENYPDLKANENFLHLQGSLNEVEAQLSASRRAYNASVLDFNNGVEMFPSSIMAGMMKLKKADFLETPKEEKEKPNIKKLFNS